jgi:hypothetical protein
MNWHNLCAGIIRTIYSGAGIIRTIYSGAGIIRTIYSGAGIIPEWSQKENVHP